MFNQPGAASGDKLEIEQLNGRLLLIYPKEVKVNVATSFGPKDPLVADIVVLDGPQPGEELHDAFIFPGVMIGQLKGYIGNPNPALGRVGYGVAKPGQKAPWQLLVFTEQDAAIASAWVNAHPRGFNSPAPAAQPPAVNGYVDQNAAAAQALEQQRQAAAAQQAQAAQAAASQQQAAQAAAAAGYGAYNPGTGEVSQPAAAQPPAQQAGAVNVDTIRTLLSLAVPDQDIANNTGATLDQINAIRNLPVS
jgi:hypothetical protein